MAAFCLGRLSNAIQRLCSRTRPGRLTVPDISARGHHEPPHRAHWQHSAYPALIQAMQQRAAGAINHTEFDRVADEAVRDTVAAMEATGSPIISDGEQTKPSFATSPIHGLSNLAPDGVTIPFADGHTRQLPRLSAGPFRYSSYAASYTVAAKRYAKRPVKQAVISPSALSLLYPPSGLPGYSQEEFLADLTREAETDIRRALDAGAHNVQLDFTEGRLAVKLDPSLGLLRTVHRSQ